MKLILLSIFIGLFSLAGCENGSKKKPGAPESKPVNQGNFPSEWTGTWKAQDNEWVIRIEPNGQVFKIYHVMGDLLDFRGPKKLHVEGKSGSYADLELGECSSSYNPENRQFYLTVSIDHYLMHFPEGDLEGSTIDNFTGIIPTQGNEWKMQLFSIHFLAGADPPNTNPSPKEVIFQRMTREELEKWPNGKAFFGD